ncbi:hypothetical protein [Brevibacterium sp. W7.2]|uniref:hypothetical protein n=1 Tax=Brevibacterium sp. W7.2 TaxID=2823518 RepID=UPI001BA96994|nr:hypothetical protein [Brevibacterium sp. W7.2]
MRRKRDVRQTGPENRRRLPRLTLLQWGFLLPGLGFVVAVILGAVQSFLSFVELSDARSRGVDVVCADLASMGQVKEMEIVSRGVWGYACEATFSDGGFGVTEFSNLSILTFFAIAIAVISTVALFGVFCAVAVKALVTWGAPRSAGRMARWGVGLLMAACVIGPFGILAQYAAWYRASNSGDGSPVCPSSFQGEEILGFGIDSNYLLPYLKCHGDTVTGVEFTTTHVGFPFAVFVTCMTMIVVGLALVITARVRAARTGMVSPEESRDEPVVH